MKEKSGLCFIVQEYNRKVKKEKAPFAVYKIHAKISTFEGGSESLF